MNLVVADGVPETVLVRLGRHLTDAIEEYVDFRDVPVHLHPQVVPELALDAARVVAEVLPRVLRL